MFDIDTRILENIYYVWQKVPIPDITKLPLPRLWALMYCVAKENKDKEKAHKKAQRRAKRR